MARATQSGKLKIGDEWNAISLLAQTQSNPLKAIAELVENALDAGARTISITRARKRGQFYMTVFDDGKGIPLDEAGNPDFRYVATHICDSMKRYLQNRDGVHGEFGIGLLGFWSLGEELRLASRGSDGRAWEMVIKRGAPKFHVHPLRGRLHLSGAEITIWNLLPSTLRVVTGDKLNRYLATELRDRMRHCAAQITIADQVAHKRFTVQPRQFEGEPIGAVRQIAVAGFPDAMAELYFRIPLEGEEMGIHLCRDGTRVLRNLRMLPELDHAPWDASCLEGIIDFPALSVPPATREGVVPDAASVALVDALTRVAPVILDFIRKRQEADTEKASEDLQQEVQRALVSALRQIPDSDYHLFDVGHAEAASNASKPSPRKAMGPETETEEATEAEKEADLFAGPIETVRIVPRRVMLVPHEEGHARARATDAEGRIVTENLTFEWTVTGGEIKISPHDERVVLYAQQEGTARLSVVIRQGDREARGEAALVVAETEPVSGEGAGGHRGLPAYLLAPDAGAPWRSRYGTQNAIEINSAHRDYLAARAKVKSLRRYVGKLYAKEIILLNFPSVRSDQALDRMVELLTRMEEQL